MTDNSIAFPLSSVATKSSLDKVITSKESGSQNSFQSVLDSYVTQSDSNSQSIQNAANQALKNNSDDYSETTDHQYNDGIDSNQTSLAESESSATVSKKPSASATSEEQSADSESNNPQDATNSAAPGLINILAAQTFNNKLEQQEKTAANPAEIVQANPLIANNSSADAANKLNSNSPSTNSDAFAAQLSSTIASDKTTASQTNNEVKLAETNLEPPLPEPLNLSNAIDSVATPIAYAGQAQTGNQLSSVTTNQGLPNYPIASNFYSDNWNTAVNQQILLLRHNNIDNASLILNPEHLGPIHVSIQIDAQSQTSIQFWSQNPEVRQALRDALPNLNSLFQESGLQLGSADVSSQQNSSDNSHPKFNPINRQSTEIIDDSNMENQIGTPLSVSNLVNVYI